MPDETRRRAAQVKPRGASWRVAVVVGAGPIALALGLVTSGASTPEVPIAGEPRDAGFSTCGTDCSSWVFPSAYATAIGRKDGPTQRNLIYAPDDEGDRVPDFARIGYHESSAGLLSDAMPPLGQVDRDVQKGLPVPLATDRGICDGTDARPARDHGAAIQAALSSLRAKPRDASGLRGRLRLARGHYAVWNRLVVPDGVVLSGVSAWTGADGPPTTLHACGTSRSPLLRIDEGEPGVTKGAPKLAILDELVPVGSNGVVVVFQGADAGKLKVGERVLVTRESPASWLSDINMLHMRPAKLDAVSSRLACPTAHCNTLLPYCKKSRQLAPGEQNDPCCDHGWRPGERNLDFERTVTHVEAVDGGPRARRRVFFDQPFTNALERKYGPHFVRKYAKAPVRAQDSGIENVRGISHPSTPFCAEGTMRCGSALVTPSTTLTCNFQGQVDCRSDPDAKHSRVAQCDDGDGDPKTRAPAPLCPQSETFLGVDRAENVWVKGVIAEGFSKNAIALGGESRRVTVEDARSANPRGPIAGGYRYTFYNDGQLNLIARSVSAGLGRHDMMIGATVVGPNAFVDVTSVNSLSDSGSHHRWSTGTLYDRVNLFSFDADPSNYQENAARISALNRWGEGSGHGWTGANLVVWNSIASMYSVFNPPTAQNWLIGSIGLLGKPNTCEEDGCRHDEPDLALLESDPHFDFRSAAEHGRAARFDPGDVSPSLFLTASAKRRAYLARGYAIEARHYFVGDADRFGAGAGGDANDRVFVNPAFSKWVRREYPRTATGGFDTSFPDDAGTEQNVPFTIRYDLADNEVVVHAYLAVRLERTTGTDDSHQQIVFAGPNWAANGPRDLLRVHLRCPATQRGCTPLPRAMTGPEGFPADAAGPAVRLFDLGAFVGDANGPGFVNQTVRAHRRRFGELNVNFHKRTRVDWAALTILVRQAPSP